MWPRYGLRRSKFQSRTDLCPLSVGSASLETSLAQSAELRGSSSMYVSPPLYMRRNVFLRSLTPACTINISQPYRSYKAARLRCLLQGTLPPYRPYQDGISGRKAIVIARRGQPAEYPALERRCGMPLLLRLSILMNEIQETSGKQLVSGIRHSGRTPFSSTLTL